jgi:hypothetical protein
MIFMRDFNPFRLGLLLSNTCLDLLKRLDLGSSYTKHDVFLSQVIKHPLNQAVPKVILRRMGRGVFGDVPRGLRARRGYSQLFLQPGHRNLGCEFEGLPQILRGVATDLSDIRSLWIKAPKWLVG